MAKPLSGRQRHMLAMSREAHNPLGRSKNDRSRNEKVLRKFSKVAALSNVKTPEARKALKTMSDLWTDREPTTTKGFRSSVKVRQGYVVE